MKRGMTFVTATSAMRTNQPIVILLLDHVSTSARDARAVVVERVFTSAALGSPVSTACVAINAASATRDRSTLNWHFPLSECPQRPFLSKRFRDDFAPVPRNCRRSEHIYDSFDRQQENIIYLANSETIVHIVDSRFNFSCAWLSGTLKITKNDFEKDKPL